MGISVKQIKVHMLVGSEEGEFEVNFTKVGIVESRMDRLCNWYQLATWVGKRQFNLLNRNSGRKAIDTGKQLAILKLKANLISRRWVILFKWIPDIASLKPYLSSGYSWYGFTPWLPGILISDLLPWKRELNFVFVLYEFQSSSLLCQTSETSS